MGKSFNSGYLTNIIGYSGSNVAITGSVSISGTLSAVGTSILSGSSQLSNLGYATTGSNTFQGAQTINGNLVVTGSITAQQYIVSSSVTYLTESFASGSHKFGDSLDDTHQFTGSVSMTGSLTLLGTYLQNSVLATPSNQLTINVNGTNYSHFYDVALANANGGLAIGGSGTATSVPTASTMFWNVNNNNVGVGTNSPLGRFHVSGSVGNNTLTNLVSTNTYPSGYSGLDMYNDLNSEMYIGVGGSATPSPWTNTGAISTYGTLNLQLMTSSSVRLFVSSSGNMGINTTTTNIGGFGSTVLTLQGSGSTYGTIEIGRQTAATSGNAGVLSFYNGSNGDIAGIIAVADGAVNSGAIRFLTNSAGAGSTERMKLTSAGQLQVTTSNNIGILLNGQTTSYSAIEIKNTTGDLLMGTAPSNGVFWSGANMSAYAGTIGTNSNTDLFFATNNNLVMKLTSGGKIGMGTGNSTLSYGTLTVKSNNVSNWEGFNVQAVGNGNFIAMNHNNNLGIIAVDYGTGGTGYCPLGFYTSNTEAMRVTVNGKLLIGRQAELTATAVKVEAYQPANQHVYYGYVDNGSGNAVLYARIDSTANAFTYFQYNASMVGSIGYNGTNTVYNTTSDYRIKSDFENFNGLDVVTNLKPIKFRVNNSENKMAGFVAHELQEYIPQAVTGEKDAIDEEGNPLLQQADVSQIVPYLTKAIQEQQIQIDSLKAIIERNNLS